jgi:hypothetical protein
VARKYWRASFHADSTASDPPLVKNTRFKSPGASSARRAASSIAGGCAYVQIGKYSSVSACFAAAAARSGRPWPSCTVKRPDRPSKQR